VDALMRGGSRSAAASVLGNSSSGSLAVDSGSAGGSTVTVSTAGAASGEELDALLENVMVLFRCIHGKDVFEAFYKKDLAKRLLLGKSTSTDSEKAMVARLKAECGRCVCFRAHGCLCKQPGVSGAPDLGSRNARGCFCAGGGFACSPRVVRAARRCVVCSQFTAKLEGMFKDSELAKELMAQYESSPARAALAEKEAHGDVARQPDLHVHVLTSSYWPTYTPATIALPAEVRRGCGIALRPLASL
jgi:cullin-4